jgi:hypothetical protein
MKYAILNNGRLDFLDEATSEADAYAQLANDLRVSVDEVSGLPIYALTEREYKAVSLWLKADCPSARIPQCLCDEKKNFRTTLEKAIAARKWHRKNPGIGSMRADHIATLTAAGEAIS